MPDGQTPASCLPALIFAVRTGVGKISAQLCHEQDGSTTGADRRGAGAQALTLLRVICHVVMDDGILRRVGSLS